MKVNYRDKNNSLMSFSYILSYLLIFISGILLIFVDNSSENKFINVILIIISRFLLGFANNKMMSKKYITLYLPKFCLSNVSKSFLISELIGEILGPLISLVLIYIKEFNWWKISYTKFNYKDKYNTYMNISYIISYIVIFISCLMLIFVTNSIEEKNGNMTLIIISRLLFGLANNKMMSKKYITLYLPKFCLSNVSKSFLISELIGEILGPLISLVLIYIKEFNWWKISYTKFNCIGWYSILISFIMGIIHLILFTKPLSGNFLMVKDEKNITGSNYYQKSESELHRKQYQKEQDLMYKKQYQSLKKKMNKIDDKDNLIIKTSINVKDKD